MFAKFLVLTAITTSICLVGAETVGRSVRPHSRLCYIAEEGTNIWFFSFMRCKMKEDEDFTYHRYRTVPANGRVFYENGGILEISGNKMSYLGVTNPLYNASSYVLTPTTNHPNHFIRSFD